MRGLPVSHERRAVPVFRRVPVQEYGGRGKPLPYRGSGGGAMKIAWAWLIGMTTGVGLMIWTKGVSASQAHLLELYGIGVVLGMAATVIAAAPSAEDGGDEQ